MTDWLSWLKTFLTVVEHNSFSKAAQALYKSPSAISKQISALEDYLHVNLFVRSTRKLELTEIGIVLYEQAEKLLAELDTLKTSFTQPNKNISGNITVKVPIQFGEYFLCDIFAEFMFQYPEICLSISFTTDRLFLKDEYFDLAIRSEEHPLQDKKLRELILTTQRGIFASKKYLEKHEPPTSIDDLQDHQCIAVAEQNNKFVWVLKDKVVFEPRGPLITNNPHMMKAALKAGLGLVYVSSYFLSEELASGEIIEIMPEWRPPLTNFYLEYEKQHTPERVKKLASFLKKNLSQR